LLVVMTLLVTSLILGAIVQRVLRQHRQMTIEQDHWQTIWLADAGLLRAQAALGQNRAYTGEVWTPTVATSSDRATSSDPATVTIAVQSIDPLSLQEVTVVAEYGRTSAPRSRVRRVWRTALVTPTPPVPAAERELTSALDLEN
jgi:Tfp pilus assembly protein PilX